MTALPPEAVALIDALWTPGANTKPIQRRLKKAFGIDAPRAQIRQVATRNDPPKVRKSKRKMKPKVPAAVGLVRFGFGPEIVPDRVRLVAAGTYAAPVGGFRIGGVR